MYLDTTFKVSYPFQNDNLFPFEVTIFKQMFKRL